MDEQSSERRWKPLLWLGVAAAAVVAVVAIVARRWRRRPVEGPPTLPEALLELPPGLTEEEAAARWSEGQDNAVQLKPPRTRQQIWRENLYTIFNLSLVGLAFTQALLGQWLSSLLSVGTIFLNVGINVAQEMLAMRRLAEFQRSARPKATVVREGKTRGIDPSRVVPGDVLIAGPGDQFLVDGQAVGTGQMVVDESQVTGKQGWQTVRPGDAVYAGSFCISGRGAYVCQKVGEERLVVRRMAEMPSLEVELTPLQRVVDHILRILLVFVAVFAVLLLLAFFRLEPGIPVELYNDAASVIFNIAPSGLFLMIIVTYTTGTADLAKLGALVHRARSVESLAEATVICFPEAGILTGTRMEMDPIQDPEDANLFPESRIRQVLGDYARSTSASSLVTRVLIESFEGSRRAVHEEAPFLAALGWSAVTFDDRDLRGTYVLGEPQILEAHLATKNGRPQEGESRSPAAAVRRVVSPLGRLLRRRDKEPAKDVVEEEAPEALATADAATAGGAEGEGEPEEDKARQPFFRRWAKRVGRTLRRTSQAPEQAEAKPSADQESVLLFAYRPEPVPLRDAQDNLQLPEDLIPLCEIRHSRELRPEAVEIVREFARTGVSIKLFASGEPDQLVALFRQVGLAEEDGEGHPLVGTVSGRDLEQLPEAEWPRTASENTIFDHIAPAQVGALVRSLRESGESVAVVGDGVTDLPALQQAILAIARQTSTQAALGVADIVMMGSSPNALLRVLHKGQGIVHGLLDVLKLNLTQVFYLALLIAAIRLVSVGFPYVSAQGTAIVVITVAIPSVGLSLWAEAGVVPSARFGRTLARFVAPAAVSMSLAAFTVYLYFLHQTGTVAYAQLALTYTLIYAGLLLALFAKPPWPSRAAAQWHSGRQAKGGKHRREWRMLGLVTFLGVAAFFLPWIPAAQQYLGLGWLQEPAHYAIVGLVVLGWAMVLNLTWWLLPPVEAQGRQPVAEDQAQSSHV
jgi:magnesium-transporting ATPase (P-type)